MTAKGGGVRVAPAAPPGAPLAAFEDGAQQARLPADSMVGFARWRLEQDRGSNKEESDREFLEMPLPREDVDATTPKFLRDKYAVAGVGETAYTRGSNMTTRALATMAVRNAMLDAGLKASEIDGMLSYQSNDSVFSPFVAGDLGIRLNFYMDVFGGGSSTEALVGIAIGVIEAGMCNTVVIFRSMNGFSQVRIGGTGVRAAAPISGDALHGRAYGWQSAGQMFAPTFMRHMHDFGTTPEQVAHVKMFHSRHASNNPKALYPQRYTVQDVINSRIIV